MSAELGAASKAFLCLNTCTDNYKDIFHSLVETQVTQLDSVIFEMITNVLGMELTAPRGICPSTRPFLRSIDL